MSIGKTGHVLVRTSHSRGQLKGQRFQSSKSAMSGGLKLQNEAENSTLLRRLNTPETTPSSIPTNPATGLTAMTIGLEVIVCTCNRASELDRMLAALASQSQANDVVWSVLVVDNGSTDATAKVVESWRARGSIPGLRSLLEHERGLTPARLRGVRETDAEWIAFVDDDNLLATDWIAGVGQAVAARPEAGGFGVESSLIGFRHAPTTSRTSAGALPNKIMAPRCARWIT
jgi:hypothetical protein